MSPKITTALSVVLSLSLAACADEPAPDFSGDPDAADTAGGNAAPLGGQTPGSGPPAPVGGAVGPAGGTPAPSGGTPAPVGGTPEPIGGTPGPVGGVPQPVGGEPGPVGGAPVEPEPPRENRDVEGEATGLWCGEFRVVAPVVVPAGGTLTVCPGTVITVTGGPGAGLAVAGTLILQGREDARVRIEGDAGWRGVRVGGRLEGTFFDVRGAEVCLSTITGGVVQATNALVESCSEALSMQGDMHFERSQIYDGRSVQIESGVLTLIDTVVDFRRAIVGPDCFRWTGGGARIEHSRITGCHCPLHFERTDSEVSVTDSILDGATNPVMIARTRAVMHRNHMDGVGDHLLDIGGGIDCDISDNYFNGGAPRVGTGNPGQFTGADAFRAEAVPGVGPR
ncbi:MAG: hypothetical protein ACOYM9_16860 [Bradymonadia bacterium]|jgi:hypothetical protein